MVNREDITVEVIDQFLSDIEAERQAWLTIRATKLRIQGDRAMVPQMQATPSAIAPTHKGKRGGGPGIPPKPGGPTDTILKIVKETPGISESKAITLAAQRMESDARDKEANANSTLKNILKGKRIRFERGGLYINE